MSKVTDIKDRTKPDIIVITGAPGSGKTTLARVLDAELYSYVHIDPDDILQSLWEHNVDNPSYHRHQQGIPRVHQIISNLLESQTRLIVDGHVDSNLMDKLNKEYNLVNIHCTARNTIDRFYSRELLPDGSEPNWLAGHMDVIKKLSKSLKEPISAGQRTIVVECDDGYSPTVSELREVVEGSKV